MGQTSSVHGKTNKISEEKETEIWSSVIPVSDQDVLVQNIGKKKKEKVKLKGRRKSSKLDNVHLLDIRRLEDIKSFEEQNEPWLTESRSSRFAKSNIGIVNEGCIPGRVETDEKKGSDGLNKPFT